MRRVLTGIVAVVAVAGCGTDKYVPGECGNDQREGTELCDGTDLNGLTCEELGFDGGTLLCMSTCGFDTSHCTGDACGNGSLDIGEVCDDDELGDETCEGLGFDSGTLACSATCDGFDVSDCEGEGCGNSIIEGDEDCDGLDVGLATCESLGEEPGSLHCNPDCTFDTSACGCESDCTDRECGDDGCGGSCGTCTAPEECNVFGECLCIPDCTDRECGDDGCSGSCGTCDVPESCGEDGTCECTPDCEGRDCGDDGCGGSCGTCEFPSICDEDVGICDCEPDCTDAVCGDDGCGGSCGTCEGDLTCVGGICVCVPDCAGLECGDDGCGSTCGTCTGGDVCVDGTCECIPDCAGLECGDDGCGSTCGTCTGGDVCVDGICECVPECAGYECGDDGCGSTCGTCPDGHSCVGHTCECTPDCSGRECGDNGCGGSCGTCPSDETCNLSGICVCVPDCAGRVCGDDGCGSVCGACPYPMVCNSSGTCDPPPGDTCADPFVVDATSLPAVLTGSTVDSTGDFGFAGGDCPGVSGDRGMGSNDEVWEFTPASTGIYTLTLEPTGFDPVLYVVTDCMDVSGSCVRASDVLDSDPEVMALTLMAGATYYIIVDGWATSFNEDGPYTLTITEPCVPDCTGRVCGTDGCGGSCGSCPPGESCNAFGTCTTLAGNSCADPFLIDSRFLPFTSTGSTIDAFANYNFSDDSCPGEDWGRGAMSNDEVWEVTPTATGMYTITVTPDGSWDTTVYVVTDCDSIDTTCLGANQVSGDGLPDVLDVVLTSGVTYYIIVDGWTNYSNEMGTYTIEMSDICTPDCTGKTCGTDGCLGTCGSCGSGELCDPTGHCVPFAVGDTCPDPFVITTADLPYTGAGDTTDANPHYQFGDSTCPGESYGMGAMSSDEAFLYVPAASAWHTISLDADFDTVLYVVTDCASITSTTCLGADDQVSITETLNLYLSAGVSYYIIVDGYANYSNYDGLYTLTVTSP